MVVLNSPYLLILGIKQMLSSKAISEDLNVFAFPKWIYNPIVNLG